jgi:Fic family protein
MNANQFSKRAPGRIIKTLGGICAFVPNPLPTTVDFLGDVRDETEGAMFSLGKLSSIIPALPNPELLTEPFMRREAVLSSKIEGTKTDVGQLYLFEAEEKIGTRRDKDELGDAREVFNYVVALQRGLEELKTMPVCNRLLRDMHRLLLDRVADERGVNKYPGEFRDQQAYIGSGDIQNARYVAPPASEVVSLMGNLEQYINNDQRTLPTLVKISLIHYQFEAIHPFHDGNGRLGRLLISILLASLGILEQPLLYLSAYFERHRDQYVQNLWEVSRAGAWKQWVSFFLRGIIDESEDAISRARRLMALREQYRQRLQRPKQAGASSLGLVDFLFHWPIVSVPEVAERLGMSYPGAQKNVEKLISLGMLEEITGRQRNRLYIAREVIKVLEEPSDLVRFHP